MSASAFYHCSVKSVGRAKGRSVVAAAAYRSGERLGDERTGEVFDYRARGGVLDTFILAPEYAPEWVGDRARLWNEAERAEPRANGRIATELELALPHELSEAARKELLHAFVGDIVQRYRVVTDVAIHAPGGEGDHRNIHSHVLITHREIGADGFGEIANERTIIKKVKGHEKETKIAGIAATPADIRAIRLNWEQEVNRAYERAGLDIRVDHRSHEERGIEQEPTQHLGPSATAMERRGMPSERGDANREITQRNAERQGLRGLEDQAEAIKAEIERTLGIFEAAATRTTDRAPNFDRDAANAEWAEKVAAAGIANDAAQAARETRQRPERAEGVEARAGAGEGVGGPHNRPEPEANAERATARSEGRASETARHAVQGGIAAAAQAGERGFKTTRKLLGGTVKVFETGFNLLFGWAMAPPKLSKQEAHDLARAENNVETIHAREYAAGVQADRTAQDWQIFQENKQQQDLSLSARFGAPPPRKANIGRELDDDRERERER